MITLLLAAQLALPGSHVVLDDVYYGAGRSTADPHYSEHVMDLIFPAGTGPVSMGFAVEPRPLLVFLRGGDFNKLLEDPAHLDAPETQSFLKAGFIYAEPSYAEIDVAAKEPQIGATLDVARAIQFLRTNHADWNIDPRKVFVFGHSGGAYEAYDIGLRGDYRDAASPDPVSLASSRPDVIMCWGGVTDMTCFFKKAPVLPWFFQVDSWAEVTEAQKIEASPTHWLADPVAYGRTTTPIIGLLYNLDYVAPCGAVINPHDGQFGLGMLDAVLQFDATQGPACQLAEEATLINIGPLSDQQAADQIAAWARSLVPDFTVIGKHR